MDAAHGDLADHVVGQPELLADGLERALAAGPARPVERRHAARLGVVVQAEHVAADACRGGLRHVEAGGWRVGQYHCLCLGVGAVAVITYPLPRRRPGVVRQSRAQRIQRQPTYSSVPPRVENVDAALGRQGLRAGHDALGAMHHAPPTRPFHKLARRRRVHRRRGKRHGEARRVCQEPSSCCGCPRPGRSGDRSSSSTADGAV